METALKSSLPFDQFTVAPRRRVLLKLGETVDLNPKTFDLLRALIERQSEIVSKDELLDAVWGELFVESWLKPPSAKLPGQPPICRRSRHAGLKLTDGHLEFGCNSL